MTRSDDAGRDRDEPRSKAESALRAVLLSHAVGNCLPMAHIASVLRPEDLGKTLKEQQDVVLNTIRSLLDDGLIEVGDILGASDERVVPWDLTIDDAMERVHDLFVEHYNETTLWDFTIWLQLTPAGERLARTLTDESAD
jgi:hypothetical protein